MVNVIDLSDIGAAREDEKPKSKGINIAVIEPGKDPYLKKVAPDAGGAVAHFNGFAIPLEPGDRVTQARVCPKCGRTYTEYPALSRADNVTEICPECGTREALEAFERYQEGR